MSEIKKSVVTKVQPTGTWDTKREPIKTFFKFDIEMENGDTGEYSSVNQEQDKFVEGQEVEYEYLPHSDFPKIKPYYQRQDSTGGGGYNVNVSNQEPERIARSVALKVASEQAVHLNIAQQDMLELAKCFSTFILEGTIVTPKGVAPTTEEKDPF
tara:strand:+ start:324 stop:788 length:465 start_codon:yes stop_codon:yes gene_type:complete